MKKNAFGFVPIVKCVGFWCNMACEYCFYYQMQRPSHLMSRENLEYLIRETFRANISSPSVNFVWHGGEPLIAGKKFYRNVLKLQKKYNRKGQEIINGLQTNGTLIDEDWARFFKEEKFQIGVSLDGLPQYHDKYRHYQDGKGSFKNVMKGIETLRKYEVPFGIVCVVTSTTVQHAEEMFRFFVDNEIFNIKFSRALARTDSGELLPFAPNPDKYGDFLLQILRLWLEEDNPRVKITPINEIFISLFRGKSSLECLFSNKCSRFWIVNPNGDVHACISEGIGNKWKFGNIANGVETIIDSPIFQNFQEIVKELRKPCLKCKWYNICKGGCTIDYELEFPFLGKRNVLCRSFQRLFQKAKEELRKYNLI